MANKLGKFQRHVNKTIDNFHTESSYKTKKTNLPEEDLDLRGEEEGKSTTIPSLIGGNICLEDLCSARLSSRFF